MKRKLQQRRTRATCWLPLTCRNPLHRLRKSSHNFPHKILSQRHSSLTNISVTCSVVHPQCLSTPPHRTVTLNTPMHLFRCELCTRHTACEGRIPLLISLSSRVAMILVMSHRSSRIPICLHRALRLIPCSFTPRSTHPDQRTNEPTSGSGSVLGRTVVCASTINRNRTTTQRTTL